MLRKGLECIGGEIRIIALTGVDETTQQMVELFLINFLLSTCGNNPTRADIIKVVQPLGSVASEIVDIDVLKGIYRLSLQTYIIIIGGSDNGHLRFCIAQTL